MFQNNRKFMVLFILDIPNNNNLKSFEYESKLLGITVADGSNGMF